MADRAEDTSTQRVCVGAVAGVHGVRGAVRIKTFTEDPKALADYSGLTDDRGHSVRLKIREVRNDLLIAAIEGVNDRDAAQALKGTRLFVPRAALPEAGTDEYYHADLVGLSVETADGAPFGRIQAVHDFGAGDVLEIAGEHGVVMVPFTRETVPEVNVSAGRVVIDPPPGLPGIEAEDGA